MDLRIVIADDHAMFCDALRNLIEQEPGYRVVGEASNGREAIKRVRELAPDLLLLDLVMPQMSGLEVLRELSNRTMKLHTIVLAAEIERPQVVEALRCGARGVILKDTATRMLFKAMRTVMAGEYWVGRDGIADLVDYLRAAISANAYKGDSGDGFHLSPREQEIMTAIVEGCTNKDIAQLFSISEQTVKHHLTKIFWKAGVSNRLELVLFAVHRRSCSAV
jgi:DNA-binding NarL/FixJ family response regulator